MIDAQKKVEWRRLSAAQQRTLQALDTETFQGSYDTRGKASGRSMPVLAAMGLIEMHKATVHGYGRPPYEVATGRLTQAGAALVAANTTEDIER